MINNKRRIGFWGFILRLINILLIIALLFSYLAQWISPSHFWPIAFFGMAYPAIATLNLLFVFHWIIRRRKFVIYPSIALLIGIGMISRFIGIGSNMEMANNRYQLKVLSYNVHVFGRYIKEHKENRHYERDQIIQFVKEQQADIVCMQEFRSLDKSDSENNLKKFKNECGFKYHYAENYCPKSENFYQVIFSKYPIKYSGYILSLENNSERTGIFADIEYRGKIIRVYSIHLQSFQISSDIYLIQNNLNNLDITKAENQAQLKKTSKFFTKKFKIAFDKRAKQIEALKEHMDKSPYPIILAGDFNDTPNSYAYGQLIQELEDAFVENGSGFGQTYIGPYPSFRIDFIFHSPEFDNIKFNTLKVRYSDHYPITATFSLAK